MEPTLDKALAKLSAWRASLAELSEVEQRLAEAMLHYAHTLEEPPRGLIIESERKREQSQHLFEEALAALDANSRAKTGHTNFGDLR